MFLKRTKKQKRQDHSVFSENKVVLADSLLKIGFFCEISMFDLILVKNFSMSLYRRQHKIKRAKKTVKRRLLNLIVA